MAEQVKDIDRRLYDFVKPEKGYERYADGLTPEIVESISRKKDEPDWMLELRLKSLETYQRMEMPANWGPAIDGLDMDPSYLDRELNVGFSGGEKKKVEMLQLLLLQPKLAILDETDSGLDVDALSVVSRGIEAYRQQCDGALLVITHNTRILERLDVDRTHVMVKGNLVAEGGADLIPTIDREGFEQFEARLGQEDA